MARRCVHCDAIYGEGKVIGTGACPACKRVGKDALQTDFVDPTKFFRFIFKLIKWILIVPMWWVCKKFALVLGKIFKNKWVWTICTCGMSLAAWKMLNAIYAPKE